MKLIGTTTSPFVRKVRVALAEKKIDYEWVLESPWTADSKVPNFNPLGKVPVLVLDDESTLFDSRVIVEHLDNGTPNSKLIPPSGRERMLVKRWEVLADGLAEAAINAVLERKRADGERSESWHRRQTGKVKQILMALAAELGEQAWCHGNAMSLADIAVGVALGYLDFRLPEYGWRLDYPNLEKLYDKLIQRQSFVDSVPVE